MSRVQTLQAKHKGLWEQVVGHPFTVELGGGSLPLEKFQRYFLQDYVFLRAFTTLIALAIAKAPSYASARPLAAFLSEVMQGEEALFRRAFDTWGWRPEQYERPKATPTAKAMGEFMVRVAYEGSYAELLTVLAVTELTYLEWAARQSETSKLPANDIYGAWIDIHANADFKSFTEGLARELDSLALISTEEERVAELFEATLRYELAFFDMGYRDEAAS